MPDCPTDLHDLLLWLLEREDAAKEELQRRARPAAADRILKRGTRSSGKRLLAKQRTFLKDVQDGKRNANEVYRNDPALWWAYQCELSAAENDLAAPIVRDTKEIVNGKLRTRLAPLNLALRELVIAGIGIDERQIRNYLIELNPVWGRGPDPAIAKRIAELHEKGVTTTILRKLRREHSQLFKSVPLLQPSGVSAHTASAPQGNHGLGRPTRLGNASAQVEFANPLVEVLVTLELADVQRELKVATTTAQRLLDDKQLRTDILRARFSSPKAATPKDLTFNASEQRELREFASGEEHFPNHRSSLKVHHAMVLGSGDIESELRQRESEEYVERGGSYGDWSRHLDHPLDKYVLERIEVKITELLGETYGALHGLIFRTIEDRVAKHEEVGWALDRLVENGFASELLRDIWDRYRIEAGILELPKLGGDGDEAKKPSVLSATSQHDVPASRRKTPIMDENAWLTARDIAATIGADHECVRKRLARFREKNHDCFREVAESERKPRESRYLYSVRAVRAAIEGLIASGESSGERPAK